MRSFIGAFGKNGNIGWMCIRWVDREITYRQNMIEVCILLSAAYALGVKCALVEYALGGQIGKTTSAAHSSGGHISIS